MIITMIMYIIDIQESKPSYLTFKMNMKLMFSVRNINSVTLKNFSSGKRTKKNKPNHIMCSIVLAEFMGAKNFTIITAIGQENLTFMVKVSGK